MTNTSTAIRALGLASKGNFSRRSRRSMFGKFVSIDPGFVQSAWEGLTIDTKPLETEMMIRNAQEGLIATARKRFGGN